MPLSCSTTCPVVVSISTGLTSGPPACCSRSLARPSQNWATSNTALYTVGALRPPRCQRWPSEVSCRSTPPMPIMWQELQLIAWLSDRRGSKYSILPSATLSGVAGLPGSAGGVAGIGLNSCCARCCRSVCDHAGAASRALSESDARRWIGRMAQLPYGGGRMGGGRSVAAALVAGAALALLLFGLRARRVALAGCRRDALLRALPGFLFSLRALLLH